jgi:hypothetical protein
MWWHCGLLALLFPNQLLEIPISEEHNQINLVGEYTLGMLTTIWLSTFNSNNCKGTSGDHNKADQCSQNHYLEFMACLTSPTSLNLTYFHNN